MPYNLNVFAVSQQPGAPAGHQHMQLSALSHSQSSIAAHHFQQTSSQPVSDVSKNDELGRLQGLDISSKVSSFVKSDGPSLSASESSTTF